MCRGHAISRITFPQKANYKGHLVPCHQLPHKRCGSTIVWAGKIGTTVCGVNPTDFLCLLLWLPTPVHEPNTCKIFCGPGTACGVADYGCEPNSLKQRLFDLNHLGKFFKGNTDRYFVQWAWGRSVLNYIRMVYLFGVIIDMKLFFSTNLVKPRIDDLGQPKIATF